MSDLSRSFLPWEDGFTRGLYLAGVQVPPEALPPEGWVKWTLPAFASGRELPLPMSPPIKRRSLHRITAKNNLMSMLPLTVV